MAKSIGAAVEQAILNDWQGGLRSTTQLSQKHKVSTSAIRRLVARHGFEVMRNYADLRATSPRQDVEIVRRYVAGESSKALATEFGFKTHISVLKRVREAEQSVAARGNRMRDLTSDQVAKILRLRQQGMTQEAIASQVGVGQYKVSACLISHGHRTRIIKHQPRVPMSNGYFGVRVRDDDPIMVAMATRGRYVLEHRYVMAKALDRPLAHDETVHHINGDRADNRLANLQLRQGRHGKGAAFRCTDCGSHNVEAMPLH